MAKIPWTVDVIKARGGYRVRTMLAGREVDSTPVIAELSVAEQTQECLAAIMRGRAVKDALNAAIRSQGEGK